MPISHVLCYVAKKHFVKPHTLLQRVVKTPLYHYRSLKILRQQTLWQQIYWYLIESPRNYRNDDYFQMIIVQPRPPCTQCRTSEKAAFLPTGATTRSSSPSSQPLIGLAGNNYTSIWVTYYCQWSILQSLLSWLRKARMKLCGSTVVIICCLLAHFSTMVTTIYLLTGIKSMKLRVSILCFQD